MVVQRLVLILIVCALTGCLKVGGIRPRPPLPVSSNLSLHEVEVVILFELANQPLPSGFSYGARIADQANGGQILVSSLLKQLTESVGDVRFGAERKVSLKGITEPQQVVEVTWE